MRKSWKVRHSELIGLLQNLIGFIPSQTDIRNIIEISQPAMSNRVKRDSEYSDTEITKIEKQYGIYLRETAHITPSDVVELDFYPEVFASCGDGCTVFEESSTNLQVTKDVITNYSSNNKYSIISARGSSMSPVINDDDRLIIQHNVESQIIDDTVYLFRYNGELFIKRLVKNVDQIVCISENPRFQDRIIVPQEDNFSIIGKVVGLFRSKV